MSGPLDRPILPASPCVQWKTVLVRCRQCETQGAAMRVLVVEDEPDLLAVVARALREAGYAVDEAVDGEDGLFHATSWDYDAIVLDLMLPKLNGWQLLGRLRSQRKVPVL